MPNYDYQCDQCHVVFEEFLSMSEMNKPCDAPCASCGAEGSVKKAIFGFPGLATDTTLTPVKATGGKWGELMKQMKPKAGSYGRRQLDRTDEVSKGRRHYG